MSKSKKADKFTLRKMSFEDVQNIYNYLGEYSENIENPELLADVAESLKIAIETQDVDMLEKARQQIIFFFLQDQGPAITDSLFDDIRGDGPIDSLF